jgi:heme-degrading monooxygenase HmoA
VEIEVKEGMAGRFIAGVESVKAIFQRAAGCRGMELLHSIEHPGNFFLMIKWESETEPMALFLQSPDYVVWRAAVGECIAGAKMQRSRSVVS